jgi:predicted alpha/beta hydrolase family esterase
MKTIEVVAEVNVRYEHFAPENENLAVLIAGFAAPIKYFSPSIKRLQKTGFSVIAVEYDGSVLNTGDPKNLLLLIDKLTELVQPLTNNYKTVYFCGPSLGSYIAWNIMQRISRPCIGLYATAGIAVSRAVFHSKNFVKVRQAFVQNGYDEAKLLKAWEIIETTPARKLINASHPFTIYATKQDKIVDYKTAQATIEFWQSKGVPVELKTVRLPGHYAISLWFMRNVGKLIARDQKARSKT